MEIILKSDNKTLEFVSGSQELNTGDVNLNDDLLHVLTVKPELELSKDGRESLAVVFEFDSTKDITVPLTLLAENGGYVCAFPDAVLATEGVWEITILRRRYKNANHEGDPAQTASNTYSFTVSESVKSKGTPVTAAMLQTLYDNADERATDAEAAKVAAEASESNAKSYAESALEYRNAAQVAAENAAAEATEKATKAATDAETAREAAVAAKDAAEIAQADAESAATEAAAEAVREVNERISATDTKVNDLKTDIAVLNNALIVGGITYKADTETPYNERITADGLPVLDGSKAVLKKVVGSTVACKNLLPKAPVGTTYDDVYGIYYIVNDDGSIVVGKFKEPTVGINDETHSVFTISKNIPILVGLNYTVSGCPASSGLMLSVRVNKDGKWQNQYDSINGGFTTFTVEEGFEYVAQIYVNISKFTGRAVIEPMINYGDTKESYEAYFAGLKSASFGGIETTGRNLFDTSFITDITYTNGSSVTVNSDGSISVVKNAGDRIQFQKRMYLPKGVYTLSNGLNSGSLVFVEVENGGTTFSRGAVTFNWNGGYTNLILYSENTASGVNVTLKPQLGVGETVTEFEKYQIIDTFSFPNTPTPMATTLDFENKKIIEGSKEIVFKGDDTETWRIAENDKAQAVKNAQIEGAFAVLGEKLARERDERCCGDNSIINYLNATFYPKMVADITTGTTTTAQTTYNPLPNCGCGCK